MGSFERSLRIFPYYIPMKYETTQLSQTISVGGCGTVKESFQSRIHDYYVNDDSYLLNLFMCQLIMDTVRNVGLANLQICAHNNARYLEWKSKDQTSNMMK